MRIKRNLLKKLKVVMLIPIISSLCSGTVYASDTQTETNDTTLKSILMGDNLLEIKKISNGSVEDINISSKTTNLSDGMYLLNRGTGWVLEGDKSFLKSAFVSSGTTGYIEVRDITIKETTEYTGTSLDIGPDQFKILVEKALEHNLRTEQILVSDFQIQAPNDKNIYMKLYSTYNRYDLIKVQDNKIIGQISNYEPEGSWLKYTTYKSGETVNQSDMEEKVTRCVLGEPNEVNIKSSITIQGADALGYTFDSFKLGFDFNDNSISFLDRRDMFIHEGFRDTKYFELRLLDKSKKEKISIELTGKDKSNDNKYDILDNFNFEIGDYVEMFHAEPFRMKFNNITGSTQLNNNTQIYKITHNGLQEEVKENNNISVSGTKGTSTFKAFDLELNHDSNTLTLKNRSSNKMSDRFNDQNDLMISISIYEPKTFKNRYLMELYGKDSPNDPKYNIPNGCEFKIGDRIRIYIKDNSLISTSGYIEGGEGSKNDILYEIIDGGLKRIY